MIADAAITVLLVLSGLFGLTGSYGLLKLPETMMRLHAPTKVATIGTGFALIAVVVYFCKANGTLSLHALLIALFLFFTAPVTSHLIARVHIRRSRMTTDLPPTGTGVPWAVQAAPIPTPDA